LLTENYGQSLAVHAGDGTQQHGTSLDGAFRNGLAFEPIVNCYGLWPNQPMGKGSFGEHPAAPKMTRSAMWLAALTAGMVSELVFILSPTGGWESPLTPGGGWLQNVQVAIWAEEMRSLLPSFLRPFEQGPHPASNVSFAKALRPVQAALPGTAATPLRAQAYQEECPTPMPCLHMVVVNLLPDTPVQFTIDVESPAAAEFARRLAAPEAGAPQVLNATRLFDDGYNTTLGFSGDLIVLSDFIGPGNTNVYEIGCDGAKPEPTAFMSAKQVDWQPCANRRVQCWDHTSQC